MLSKRLEHFEKHQLSVGDEYGAEILHHANKRIAQLELENAALQERIDELEKEHGAGITTFKTVWEK